MQSTDRKFLETAIALATIWSKHPSVKVAAVAVGDKRNQVAFGYNGLPPGLVDTSVRLEDKPRPFSLTLHAEVNALANATFDVRTLYVTHQPCVNCALHILSRRTVKRVVCLESSDLDMVRWGPSIESARALLAEGGVELVGVSL